MISKRNRRPARPQENIRQFSLNNSKGVDSSKSPTDVNTVSAATNLIVNPDGSMSLRKPIAYVPGSVLDANTRQYYLYNNTSKLVCEYVDEGTCTLKILEYDAASDSYVPVPVKMTYTSTTDSELVYVPNPPGILSGMLRPRGDLEVTNLSSATVLSNCEVFLEKFNTEQDKAVDYSLYDDNPDGTSKAPKWYPRYVHVYYSNEENIWVLAVKRPEPNTLTTAETEIPLDPNLTLDNPLMTRDTYNAIVPAIKGILPYVNSTVDTDGVVTPVTEVSKDPMATHSETYVTDVRPNPTVAEGTNIEIPIKYTIFDDVEELPTVTVQELHKIFTNVANDQSLRIVQDTVTIKASWDVRADVILRFRMKPYVELIYRDAGATVFDRALLKTSTDNYVNAAESLSWETTLEPVQVRMNYPNSAKKHPNFDESWVGTEHVFSAYDDDAIAQRIRIADLIESEKTVRPRMVTALASDVYDVDVYLKAFGNLPKSASTYYATWLYSVDNAVWHEAVTYIGDRAINVRELSDTYSAQDNDVNAKPPNDAYITRHYTCLTATSERDYWVGYTPNDKGVMVLNRIRPDVLKAPMETDVWGKAQFMFKIVTVEPITNKDVEYDNDNPYVEQYRVTATVAQQVFSPVFKSNFEFFDIEFGNTVYGKKLYHKKALYSYGSEKFFNNIFVSDIDSFITPLYNVIDLDTYSANSATCLIPWRDYLVSATDNAIYLHTKLEDGFLTKTVNTSIGIPEEDSRCCKAVLNGILFKSGPKIYQAYPNMYSGDDSTLNLTEISKAVEEILEAYVPLADYPAFAFSTDSEYIIMLPSEIGNANDKTICLRYDYTSKLWTVCTYPIVATDYKILNLNDIRVFGIVGSKSAEFKFDANPEIYDSEGGFIGYGDILTDNTVHPIEFTWDTGQKTDNISVAKQFVESKLVFATEDVMERFPMELTVHVDGDPHVTTLDLNSDAPFWKIDNSLGIANTAFQLSADSDTRVFKQLIVRYSGKGRSVRHILTGSPNSNFRLYETYVRYKTLNVKR